jgi:hypothetical protein
MIEINSGWATRRAGRGAILLDRCDPGWARRIDKPTLIMHHSERCIAGQLARTHPELPPTAVSEYDWYVWDFLGLDLGAQVDHGFAVSVACTGDDLAWELLGLAWISEVAARVDDIPLQHLLPMAPTEPCHG